MPVHDWSPVPAGLFHHFHQRWVVAICDGLNDSGLPEGFYALVERHASHVAEDDVYAARADRIAVRTSSRHVVAVIEVVSPGNKSNQRAIQSLSEKSLTLLRRGIHLLIVDLFPPSVRDPQGVHPLVWEEMSDEPFILPPDKPLTLAAYAAGPPPTAYVEPVAVGDALPDMPVFLDADSYVPVALDRAYQET